MKTGLIIEATETEKGLNDFSVKRVHIKGENWISNQSNDFNMIDANKWVDLMIEGTVTVIYTAHDLKEKDSAEFLREVISKLEQSFIKPANTSISYPESKDYTVKNINNDIKNN